MLNVTLAVLSGLIWGIGDFAGGKATQRAGALPVVWVSKLVSLPLLAIYLIATYVPMTSIGLAWGAMAGVAGLVGLVLFYRALSAGAMTVVAPVTGVTSSCDSRCRRVAWGERPSAARLLGIGCALLAIALVSIAPNPPGGRQVVNWRLIAVALGSGAGFGLFFILLAFADEAAGGSVGLWPIAGSQLSSLIIGGLAHSHGAAWTVAPRCRPALHHGGRPVRHDGQRALSASRPQWRSQHRRPAGRALSSDNSDLGFADRSRTTPPFR